MKKRMLAMLLVLAMALSLMPPVAFAAETEDYAQIIADANAMSFDGELPTYCPKCGEGVTWTPLTQESDVWNKSEVFTSGHYYLAGDIVSNSDSTLYLAEWHQPGDPNTICLHLNNHTLESKSDKAIHMWTNYTLNIMGNGLVKGSGATAGALRVSPEKGSTNIYGGTYTGWIAMGFDNGTNHVYNATINGHIRVNRGTTTLHNATYKDIRVYQPSGTLKLDNATVTKLTYGNSGTVNVPADSSVTNIVVESNITANNVIHISGDGTVGTVNPGSASLKLSGGVKINKLTFTEPVDATGLTAGASINLGGRTGIFTTPFASKEAAEAAIPYFVNAGDTITVSKTNALAAGATSYFVGYSKVDINPYAEDGTILPMEMAGFGDNTTRLALAEKLDDNGDGVVDENDGIFATCTAITDSNGKTVLMFTADLLWGYNGNYGEAVMDALLGEEFKDEGLDESRIFFNGSHNHFAPSMAGDSAGDMYAAYNAYLKNQFITAAREALADRAWADMYQNSMEVVDYFNANNGANKSQAVGDLLNDMQASKTDAVTEKTYAELVGQDEDIFFTCVRHFKITEQRVLKDTVTFTTNQKGVKYPNGGTIDESAPQYTYYAGNGTNGDWVGVGHINTIYEYDPVTGIIYDGTNGNEERIVEYRKVVAVEEATETEDTLRVVEFRFGSNSGKDPVVMINWRGHLPSNSSIFGVDENYNNIVTPYKTVSGGMPNALRNAMAFKGYRASFLQGETGNINMSFLGKNGAWTRLDTRERVNIFGTELAQLALELLEDADKINEDGGEIRSVDQTYQGDMYRSTVFEFIAAKQYKRAVAANGGEEIGRRVYTDISYYVDANGNPLIDKETGLPIEGDAVGDPIVCEKPITITNLARANTMDQRYYHNPLNGVLYTQAKLNALTIGDDFRLVSVAAEIFDHYIGENGENLWDTLAADHKDPFILGCTNSNTGSGYMPDKNTYHYMHSGKDPNYMVGTYESDGTRFAEGYGEKVVLELDAMLSFLENDHPAGQNMEGTCAHCDKDVTWIDLSREVSEGDLRFEEQFASGHYYLPEGKTATLTGKEIPAGVEVCIDLNGQTLEVYRAIKVLSGGKLTMLDSKGSGKVDGYERYKEGGMFNVAQDAEMNVYGGTYQYKGQVGETRSNGGIVYVSGKFTMYGGTIYGTEVTLAGGTMYIGTTGHAFFRGGKVTTGSITTGTANGKCITVTGAVTLSGDPNIDSLFYIGYSGSKEDPQNTETQKLNFDGVFTGNVAVSGVETGDPCIGVASADADVSLGALSQNNSYHFHIEDGLVYLRPATDYVAKTPTGEFIYGDYTADANTVDESKLLNTVLQTLPDGSRVVMLANIASSATVAVNQNLQWELKGKTVNCNFTVAENKSISFTDCVGTGKVNLAKVTGTVGNASASEDGKTVYVPITGNDGYATLHQARVNIDQLVLRADNQDENGKASPGLYFKHRFDGDEVVKDLVESYGIAFSLTGAPTAADLQAEGTLLYEDGIVYRSGNVVYTKLDGAQFGEADADSTSALITGVMKEENGASINARNAQMPIYGVAYLKLTSGAVVFGQVRERTFQQQLEGIDTKWEELTHAQRKGVLKMYKVPTIKSVVDGWTVPNLKNPEKSQAAEEKDTLRILAIGNSHTVDTTNLLYKVFEAQKTENGYETAHGTYKNVMIGNMYYSGCAVSQHVGFETSNAPVYVYYTYTADGNGQKKQTTLRQGLNDQVWDIVILHEMNSSAGAESTYTGANKRNLQKHINYIKENCLNSDPKFIWNFSWANPTSEYLWSLGYPAGENYDWVDSYEKTYGNDYDYMLSQMVKMTKSYVMTNSDIDDVIPTGLAVDFLRKHENNPNPNDPDVLLYRDYTHMSDFGRLMTSYLWFATITGKTEIDSVNMDVIPKYSRVEQNWPQGDMEVTQDMKDMIQEAVQYAISQEGTLLPE